MPEGVRACGLRYQETGLLWLNKPSLLWLKKATERLLWLLLLAERICGGLLRQDEACWLHLDLLLRESKWLCCPKLLLSELLLLERIERSLLLEVG